MMTTPDSSNRQNDTVIPQRWQQLLDDFNADYFRSPQRVLHSLQVRVGISAEEAPEEWQLLLERWLGVKGPFECWNSLPRAGTEHGPMHCLTNADTATRHLLFDACDLVRNDPDLSLYRTDNFMLLLYLIAWQKPRIVSYCVNQTAFRPDDSALDVRPFRSRESFESWERGEHDIPSGRYFLSLNRDVRRCAVIAIGILFGESEVEDDGRWKVDEPHDELVRAILSRTGITAGKWAQQSPEKRRNIIFAYWRSEEKLTPAQIRDRWHEKRGLPKLRSDNKNRAAQDVKNYIKRGCALLAELTETKS